MFLIGLLFFHWRFVFLFLFFFSFPFRSGGHLRRGATARGGKEEEEEETKVLSKATEEERGGKGRRREKGLHTVCFLPASFAEEKGKWREAN